MKGANVIKIIKQVALANMSLFLFVILTFKITLVPSSAAAPIELRYGSPYPPDHVFSIVDVRVFEKIEKETRGLVKIRPYWSGTLLSSKDGVDELARGVVDLGVIHPSYSRTGFAIHKAAYFFFYGANQEVGRKVFLEVLKSVPEIEEEYTKAGLKVLSWTSGVDYQLLSRRLITKMDDLKGMRVKITADLAEVFKVLGAEGVVVPMTETYEQLQKGILDAALISYEGLKSFRLAEVAKYLVILDFYRTHGGSRAMNLKVWQQLPPEVKKVFEDNIEYWGVETDKEFEKKHEEGIAFGKQMGVQFIKLPESEIEKFYAPLRSIAEGKAKELDRMGYPGTKVLEEAQRLIKKYKAQ